MAYVKIYRQPTPAEFAQAAEIDKTRSLPESPEDQLRNLLRRALPVLFTHPPARTLRKHYGAAPTKNELARRALRADIERELKKNGATDDKSEAPKSERSTQYHRS